MSRRKCSLYLLILTKPSDFLRQQFWLTSTSTTDVTYRLSPDTGFPQTQAFPSYRVSPDTGFPQTQGFPRHRVSLKHRVSQSTILFALHVRNSLIQSNQSFRWVCGPKHSLGSSWIFFSSESPRVIVLLLFFFFVHQLICLNSPNTLVIHVLTDSDTLCPITGFRKSSHVTADSALRHDDIVLK